MNRKASIFALGMVLAAFIFMGLAWGGFFMSNKNVNREIGLEEPMYLKNIEDKFILYSNQAAKLSASQAFYELSEESVINRENKNCKIYSGKNYIIWDQNCKPKQEIIDHSFINKYTENFNDFIQNYNYNIDTTNFEYFHVLEENEITTTSHSETIKITKKTAFATYNISYEFHPSITLELTNNEIYLNDFVLIYQQIISARQTCETNDDQAKCIEDNINAERWSFDITKESSYFVCEFRTKNYFFFEDENGKEKFARAALNFAINEE
jgi:hypothetical protein